jgi:hypothetical protein
MVARFATIGHSNRSLREFLEMLGHAQVERLVDVRSFPKSRSNPVFNIDRQPDDLTPMQIAYRHCAALGGRRPKQSAVAEYLSALRSPVGGELGSQAMKGATRRLDNLGMPEDVIERIEKTRDLPIAFTWPAP